MHVAGPLLSGKIASISCSGGEASLIADLAHDTDLIFPMLTKRQSKALSDALGPKVALANPLDYHTYIWRDAVAMTQAFSAMIDSNLAMTFLIVDFPRGDICDDSDWECAIVAALETRATTNANIAMVATLPELMPEHIATRLMQGGIIPLNGLAEALAATEAAQARSPAQEDIIVPAPTQTSDLVAEDAAKTALTEFGISIPAHKPGSLEDLVQWTATTKGPFVLKTTGVAHKSESGGVALSLTNSDAVRAAGANMQGDTFLIEEMIEGTIAELLVGVVKDPAHGFVMTIAAGGIFAEIVQDQVSMLLPASKGRLKQALTRLKIAKILMGYRNQPAADLDQIITAIDAVQSYVLANLETVEEVEVNPLIVTQERAIAVDALIRKRHDQSH